MRSRSPFFCVPLALIFHTHGKSAGNPVSLTFYVGQILQERQNFVSFSKDLYIFRFSETWHLRGDHLIVVRSIARSLASKIKAFLWLTGVLNIC